jgi:hypothetical protein
VKDKSHADQSAPFRSPNIDEFLLKGRPPSSWVQRIGIIMIGSAFLAFGLFFSYYAIQDRSMVIGGAALCYMGLCVRILVRTWRVRGPRLIRGK